MPLFSAEKYKAKLLIYFENASKNPRNDGTNKATWIAFENYKMETIVSKFERWINERKYGHYITALIYDGNGELLIKYKRIYVDNNIEYVKEIDNWNG